MSAPTPTTEDLVEQIREVYAQAQEAGQPLPGRPKNLVITLDDDLATMIHEAAGEDISAWIAQAARDPLTRKTWERSN